MTKLICGWCDKDFQFDTEKGEHGYKKVFCPNCGRAFPGSKKESTGNLVGRKHVHTHYKSGDVLR